MDFPPPPRTGVNWNSLPFDVSEVNGHVEIHYDKSNDQWSEPKFVQDPYLRIHGFTPALHYAQQAFEGLKAYRLASGKIVIFRPNKNAARLQRSVAFISSPSIPEEQFLQCVNMAVAKNAEWVPPHGSSAALYLRPFIFGCSPTLAMASPNDYMFCVYVTPVGVAYGTKPVKALVAEDYDRVAPHGTGKAKIGGNYSPIVRHIKKAVDDDYGILLHLDSKTRTEIDEFSMAGFVAVQEDGEGATLIVPELERIVESVTSDSVCQIARDLGWKTERRAVRYDELGTFSEVMAVGTASLLVSIKSVTRKSTGEVFEYGDGTDSLGRRCAKLTEILKGIQLGEIEDRHGWCYSVNPVER